MQYLSMTEKYVTFCLHLIVVLHTLLLTSLSCHGTNLLTGSPRRLVADMRDEATYQQCCNPMKLGY